MIQKHKRVLYLELNLQFLNMAPVLENIFGMSI